MRRVNRNKTLKQNIEKNQIKKENSKKIKIKMGKEYITISYHRNQYS